MPSPGETGKTLCRPVTHVYRNAIPITGELGQAAKRPKQQECAVVACRNVTLSITRRGLLSPCLPVQL